MSIAAAAQLLRFIDLLEQTRSNIRHVNPTFRFQLITAAADYIITEDRHFAPLATARYQPQPITPAEIISKHL